MTRYFVCPVCGFCFHHDYSEDRAIGAEPCPCGGKMKELSQAEWQEKKE